MRRSAEPGLHLLEVGVQWPPETFLRRKFTGLAAAGIRVTVAADIVRDGSVALPGVELVRSPRGGAGSLGVGLALAVRSPRRLVRLVRGVGACRPRSGGATADAWGC